MTLEEDGESLELELSDEDDMLMAGIPRLPDDEILDDGGLSLELDELDREDLDEDELDDAALEDEDDELEGPTLMTISKVATLGIARWPGPTWQLCCRARAFANDPRNYRMTS